MLSVSIASGPLPLEMGLLASVFETISFFRLSSISSILLFTASGLVSAFWSSEGACRTGVRGVIIGKKSNLFWKAGTGLASNGPAIVLGE